LSHLQIKPRLVASYSLCTIEMVYSKLHSVLTMQQEDFVKQVHRVVLGHFLADSEVVA